MIIDLCCGYGRFEGEDVISIDINPKVKPTIVADIEHLPLRPNLRPKLCHASPPCTYFSYAQLFHTYLDEKGMAASLRLVAACFEAFAYLNPVKWTMENPKGYLEKWMPPTATVEYAVADLTRKRTLLWSNDRSLRRAIIPKDVRQRLLE